MGRYLLKPNRTAMFFCAAVCLSFGGLVTTTAQGQQLALNEQKTRELEHQLSKIDAQLSQLSRYTPRGGVGNIGFRSRVFEEADHTVSLRVDLKQPTTIDQIVLVPTLVRNTEVRYRPDGFPQALRILDNHGTVLATWASTKQQFKRISPVLIPVEATKVSGLVIEVTRLGSRAFDQHYVLQLAEILVFSGTEDVALGRPVTPLPDKYPVNFAWAPDFLTDGSLPYLMNAGRGRTSLAYLSPRIIPAGKTLDLSVDLGKPYALSEIRLHTVDQSDTIPQSAPIGIGLPRHLLVEGANQPDFSDAQSLLEAHYSSEYEISPIIFHRLPEILCRYVRLTPRVPYLFPYGDHLEPRIGFAEIELLAEGRNVVLNKPFNGPGEQWNGLRPVSALTDGCNSFGEILPLRQWMHELAQRDELENQRPLIIEELGRRYAQQKSLLWGLACLAVLLAAGVVITLLMARNIRQRAILRTREHIAADLHDEIGANLHALSLLTDLSLSAKSNPEKLDKLLREMRSLTKQTGDATRHSTNLLESEFLHKDLPDSLQKASRRLMADLDHELTVDGAEWLHQLNESSRIHLFLFHKECLVNILRHSQATRAASSLTAERRSVTLTVTDNGKGLQSSTPPETPASLARRARLMGAQVFASCPPEGGTRIVLTLKRGIRARKRLLPKTET